LAHTYVHGSSPDTERQRGCTGSSGTWVCSSRDSVKKVSLPAYRHAIVAALAVYSFIYLLRKRINKSTLPLFFFLFFFVIARGNPLPLCKAASSSSFFMLQLWLMTSRSRLMGRNLFVLQTLFFYFLVENIFIFHFYFYKEGYDIEEL
jgi:hypothetical protein